MTESVDDYLSRVAEDPAMRDRLRQSVHTVRLLCQALGIHRIEDALLFVIGQHSGAADRCDELRAELARLQACFDRQRFKH